MAGKVGLVCELSLLPSNKVIAENKTENRKKEMNEDLLFLGYAENIAGPEALIIFLVMNFAARGQSLLILICTKIRLHFAVCSIVLSLLQKSLTIII